MANVLFDVLPETSPFNAYVGGGIGINHVTFSATGDVVGAGIAPATAIPVAVSTSRTVLAYQGIAGLSYRATRAAFYVDLTYRYLTGSTLGSEGGPLRRRDGQYRSI